MLSLRTNEDIFDFSSCWTNKLSFSHIKRSHLLLYFEMPALANSSKAWRSWWDRLHELSKADGVSTTELKQFIDDPPLKSELPKLAAEDMTPTDVNECFGLTQARGPEAWQFPRPLILIRPDFETWLSTFKERTSPSERTEARSRCKIDGLLFTIWENLKAHGYLENGPNISLQFETSLECRPVTYHNKQQNLVGKADYCVLFGEPKHIACHLVILEAKQDHGASTSTHGQILAYMAMVQACRRARGQSNSTVWGALTDGQWFYFFRLNNEGQWSAVAYQVHRDGWGVIANVIAYMIVQGHETAASPLRSSVSPRSSKAARIPCLNIAASLDAQMFSAAL
ncbi:unnamed protein product [Penicillium egyptiacum]|uniref:Uncharacterized protein n=1 Tax=Penicillium egyptiacum TaxID=1303716 RepID=A0A9W4P7D7_9EURO|nr:unnamed protein product [Penicillium egyptiacum]